MEMVERRVSDASILRLIGKWINVGVVDDGRLLTSETGTGQGCCLSVYLTGDLSRQFVMSGERSLG